MITGLFFFLPKKIIKSHKKDDFMVDKIIPLGLLCCSADRSSVHGQAIKEAELKSKEWHDARKKGIGGSDSSAILGVNPWKSPRDVWAEKRGLTSDDQEESGPMKRGNFLEPHVCDFYQEATGRELAVMDKPFVHKEHSFMRGNIDRMITKSDKDSPGVLEVKCPGIRGFNAIQRDGLPDYMQVQLQHYLAVTGKTWGSFAVFSSERWELVFFDVSRDDGLIDIIVAHDASFWQMVQDGVEPAELEQATKLDLPKVKATDLVEVDSEEWAIATNRLREAKSLREEAQLLEGNAKDVLQDIMDREGLSVAEGGDMRVYWKWQNGRKTIDAKRLLSEQPAMYQEYLKVGKDFRSFRSFDLKPQTYE